MDRLTTILQHPLDTFKRCQLCGYTSNDICEFRMFIECDEQDNPEDGNILVLCTNRSDSPCKKTLDNHPRLYREMPWGQGNPGQFMLTCGDCKFRNNSWCTNPNLKSNGGEGLKVNFARSLPVMFVCFSDGTGGRYNGLSPATSCEGFAKKE